MFPLGKLPNDVLRDLLECYTGDDPRLRLGPGVGLDCAVIEFDERLLVVKSDPITFTAEQIGWYAVHVNANDVATTGAEPRWFLATILIPEGLAEKKLVEGILRQISEACEGMGAMLVGGHTEICNGVNRPIVAGTMVGEVSPERLVTPRGARFGDRLLLTKGVPIEATSILAHDFAGALKNLPTDVLQRAREFLYDPGISVVVEAQAAVEAGGVTAMHDPTEGGLAMGLWELSVAAGVGIFVDETSITIPEEARIVCHALDVNPLEAIASGALLMAVQPDAVQRVQSAIRAKDIPVDEIGEITEGHRVLIRRVDGDEVELHPPDRDALAKLFERDTRGSGVVSTDEFG
jgi:hydrogenase expression/formation protein HypE